MSWLRETMDNSPSASSFPCTPPCDTSRIICRLYSILYHPNNTDLLPLPGTPTGSNPTPAERVVLALVDERMSSSSLHNIPSGIALPILEAVHSTRSTPPEGWPAEAYHLIGREDLALTHAISEGLIKKPKPTSPEKRFQASQSKHEHEYSSSTPATITTVDEEDKEDKDGLVLVTKYAAMLFNEDSRVKEVSKLLRSSRPIFLKVDRPPEVSDHEFEQRKQQKLLLLCTRAMAAPLGRGMLTLGTCSPLLGTKLPIPDICLAGRVPPNNATVQLDTTNCSPTMKAWPDFHNGVAAGLRLTSAAEGRAINRTWIVYNRPSGGDTVNYSHGGLLMALGLRGHLGSLAMTDIYEYLTQGSDTTTVGVLLGMAATKRSTCDPSVSKMLCLHIPSLLPPPFTDMDVSSVAQIAAVAGVGLLYQGSAHRLMTEFLLGEIGRKPSSDKIADREAYVLAAGFALGMVNLGKGKTGASAGLQDLKLEERLTQYLLGGKDPQPSNSFRGGEDTSQKCSRIFEGDSINIDVTSPGATMALGLLHIKSGNKSVANRLSLPQTAADLDLCRPDFLLLRVVARALVLWDQDIEPTSEWVQRQIPDVVSRNWARLGEGGFFKVAFGVANMTIETHNVGGIGGGSKGGAGAGVDENVDEQTVKQAYVHIVAGACFALGLRFAGTGNLEAKKVIMKELLMLKKLREDNDRQTMARKPAKAMIDMSVGTAAVSLSMVMAGTGDLDTVKVVRQLRLKCEGVMYGTHACLSSALGLLFLGGGSCTLGRSNEDIAALLVAFYPRWPISSTDHQFHLQALRHLYALATVERSVECVDVITGNPVFVPVAFKEGGQDRKAMSPLLLKEDVEDLRLDTDRYYQVKFGGPGGVDALLRGGGGGTIYVKRKVGHLTYQQDPHGLRSLRLEDGRGGLEEFTEDADLLMFSKYLCGNVDGEAEKWEKDMPGLGTFSAFCKRTLPLVVEKTEALQLYLNLRSMVELLEKTRNMQVVENVKICVKTCVDDDKGGGEGLGEGLVEEEFLLLLGENVDIFFEGLIGIDRVKE
eukprot:CAMPEP_0118642732 /NCGR_PEP_ID=MMETSP0785-20121206/5991_1 /TAXON_ID=91992 /ORGANISM="Bolidomonas pacifica, Strain CCMP 1866" /LENGTH=1040 /DNA_ID=CAMNT_0006534301 /DNA_START=27 /DNA_END=3146 /DNA_ORIENTATION=-